MFVSGARVKHEDIPHICIFGFPGTAAQHWRVYSSFWRAGGTERNNTVLQGLGKAAFIEQVDLRLGHVGFIIVSHGQELLWRNSHMPHY